MAITRSDGRSGPGEDVTTTPPIAPRRPQLLSIHGDDRMDEWYGLRDRDDPEVIAYLEAENAYTASVTAHLKPLEDKLFEEFKGRIQETDESPPVHWGDHWYSVRTVEGLQYAIRVRRTGGLDEPEQVLIDENELAAGQEFFSLRNFEPSPDHHLAAYAVNFDGSDLAELRFRDLDRLRDLDDTIVDVSGHMAWCSDNRTIFYPRLDPSLRPYQIWRYRLGEPDSHTLVYEETDERFGVSVDRTRSGEWLVMSMDTRTTSEAWVLRADDPDGDFRCVEPRLEGRRYELNHHGDHFLVVTDDGGAVNSKLMEAPVDSPGHESWVEVLPHVEDVRLYSVEPFRDWIVLSERAGGIRRLRAMPATGADATSRIIDVVADEAVSTSVPGPNPEFDTSVFRYRYTSLITPNTVYDLDLDTGDRTLVKREPVLGGYDPADYVSERLWSKAADGVTVPMSLVRRRDKIATGPAPCLLYGYGSYEISIDPSFSPFVVSLLDRGVVWVEAHPRGGGELGRPWYESGKFLSKANTFTDFVACADHLVSEGVTTSDRLTAMGGSAGGLLMGAVVNLRPELFRAIVALVPFVDVVTTMLDESIPLTTGEFEEWGNPKDAEYYAYMKSYSPYDNVEAKDYPPMLVTTGLNDTRVAFWEPAKWVAKLRTLKTDDNLVLLKTEMGAGHAGPSGRYNAWRERAFWYAWVLDSLGIAD